ncbi:hypothetical protein OPV22_008369 [Ensete ventricosum]|uniref:Pyrimidine 5'-nucleotidase n=1 Tax=Ensete ventricosum TaxID=4639 RepID=A0AAV8RC34_ENSVE|nr:hypothetical protein OPV22_008369 [Ensete ventricosum]RWW73110.1 hypothetical protein BHE74_00019041 [Ensete ventricosum]
MGAAVSEAKYECLLFDLDDTLYPFSSGICVACGKNIEDYMRHRLQIEESQIAEMCLELYKEYGTTMAGLKALGYQFDNDEYHAYVHGKLPYQALKPDPLLRNLILSMPQRKMIFTNADKAHAARVLSRLGLENCFEGIICFETLNPTEKVTTTRRDNVSNTDRANREGSILCKPSLEAIETAIRIAKIDPKKTIFFDDNAKNIAAGKAAGLHTVLVGRSVPVPGADLALKSIHNVKEALPEIWQDGKQTEPVLAATAVEETTVLA